MSDDINELRAEVERLRADTEQLRPYIKAADALAADYCRHTGFTPDGYYAARAALGADHAD